MGDTLVSWTLLGGREGLLFPGLCRTFVSGRCEALIPGLCVGLSFPGLYLCGALVSWSLFVWDLFTGLCL